VINTSYLASAPLESIEEEVEFEIKIAINNSNLSHVLSKSHLWET